MGFLIRFYENLLFEKKNELRIRDTILNAGELQIGSPPALVLLFVYLPANFKKTVLKIIFLILIRDLFDHFSRISHSNTVVRDILCDNAS